MPQFGGKNAKKTKKTSYSSKRHFTVVMGGKEHGLYVSSTPSSAARKAVTKLCAANKSKKVEFHIREITQGSKKKTYGPYEGHIEKLKEPIELKGRVIKYKPVAKLSGKTGAKKGGMRGGGSYYKKLIVKNIEIANDLKRILENFFDSSRITVDINPYTNSNTKIVLDITTASDIFLTNNSNGKEKKHTLLKDEVDKKLEEILKESPKIFEIMEHWTFESNGQNNNNNNNSLFGTDSE